MRDKKRHSHPQIRRAAGLAVVIFLVQFGAPDLGAASHSASVAGLAFPGYACSVHALPDDSLLAAFLRDKKTRIPELTLQDVYKALYQEQFGIAHMLPSREAALDYLRRERDSMNESLVPDPLVEACGPAATHVRVNLRPWFAGGGSDTALVTAMIESARLTSGDSADFVRTWTCVGRLIARGTLPFSSTDFDALTAALRKQAWPAVHHSASYTAARRPAYRVVRREVARRILGLE